MRIAISAVIAGVAAAFTGDLTHSTVAGFAALVVIGGVLLALVTRRGRRSATASA